MKIDTGRGTASGRRVGHTDGVGSRGGSRAYGRKLGGRNKNRLEWGRAKEHLSATYKFAAGDHEREISRAYACGIDAGKTRCRIQKGDATRSAS